MTTPTKAQMQRALLRYGREIRRGEAIRAKNNGHNVISQVNRYCRALKAVWTMAEKMAKAEEKRR